MIRNSSIRGPNHMPRSNNGSPGQSLSGNLVFASFLDSFRVQSVLELIQRGDNAAVDGDNEDSLRHYYKALEKERSESGESSIQAALILHKIGLALARTGDSFAAMNSFEEALQIRQEKLGPGSEDAAETTAQMLKILDEIRLQSGVGERQYVKGDNGSVTSLDVGTNLLEWGEYKEAETVLKKCLENMDVGEESRNDEKIKVLGAMAELDRAQGKYDEAKELYLEVLKTAKKMNTNSDEEVDISIINSIAGYAEILRKAGDLWQAEALHMKVRNMLIASKRTTEQASSESDLQLAVSHTQLGCTVFALKKYDDALREHRAALSIRLRALELTDSLVSESFNYCAETLCAMGREAEALPLSLQATDIRAREFGTSHPSYAHALGVLSKCYHGVGRSHDARPLMDRCLGICETVFTHNHANLIPNLIAHGDILIAIGESERALTTYQRAESIHKANFNFGQKDSQLEECQEKMKHATMALKNEISLANSPTLQNGKRKLCGGTPLIIITDVGRDIDDALALTVLSSLKKMFMLNPLAVITTLAPDKERACLARLILDSLAMEDVPVGVGTDVACPGDIVLHCYRGVAIQSPYQFERGTTLISRILKQAEPNSVKLLCIANLKDISELIVKQEHLFRSKIKEVVVMGGATYLGARLQLMPDETAYNNSCDLEAARHVYSECQQNHIPMTTVSRFGAYGCPLNISFLDGLQNTSHLLAGEIRDANFKSMQQLWKKVNMPSWMPGRGKLPARCDRQWFLDFFKVNVDAPEERSPEIWQNSSFYLYDSIAMICCVDVYADLYFNPRCYVIGGTQHRVIGLIEEGMQADGIANKNGLVCEIEGLLRQALKLSLGGMDIAPDITNTSEKKADGNESCKEQNGSREKDIAH